MPSEEREKNDIAKDYQRRQGEEIRGYALREEYMLSRVYSESTLGQRKLIVCGALHTEGLAKKFRERREEVTVRDVTREEWCTIGLQKRLQMLLTQL